MSLVEPKSLRCGFEKKPEQAPFTPYPFYGYFALLGKVNLSDWHLSS
jgi:hypothetical protein